MRPLKNPYLSLPGYFCFGCSSDNVNGLQMSFFEDEEFIISKWQPKSHLQGFINILHGGIQATLMDEIASWVVFLKLKTSGVTSGMEVKYHKPVSTNNNELLLKAKLIELKKRIAFIHVSLLDSTNNLCSEANVQYFIYPEEIAKEKLHYPGLDAFYYH